MTNKNEIQYIRLYTNGSSACSVDFSTPEKKKRNKTRLPKAQVEQKLMIRLDPAALCGMAGNFIGASMTMKKGTGFIRGMLMVVLALLLAKMLFDVVK